MQALICQRVVRLTCGLGLLTLPAVQQKVCMLPEPATESQVKVVASADLPEGAHENEKRKRPTLKLTALLPDVTLPRWPAHVHPSLLQREHPLAGNGWRPDCANGNTADQFEIPEFIFTTWQDSHAPALPGPAFWTATNSPLLRDLLLGRSISPTGPPHCA